MVLPLNEKLGTQAIAPKVGVGVEQILQSVLVHVAKRSGHAIHDQIHVVIRCDVNEGAVSLVLEECIRAILVVDDEDVLPTVAVVVPPNALKTQAKVDVDA